MRIKITVDSCDYCNSALTDWDYRFQGKHYCRTCYLRFFELTTCAVCNKEKRIFIFLSERICKHCLVKDKPCIRCGKTEYPHGLISEYGPVCASCAVYFRKYKTCSSCHKESYDISNRTLLDGSKKLLCSACYNKTLPVCRKCHRHTKPHKTLGNKIICKKCDTEPDRICKQCGVLFPAGRGRICGECSYKNMLKKRTKSCASLLSVFTSSFFEEFSLWLESRRGAMFAGIHISKYYPFFSELDTMSQNLQRFPTYAEILEHLTVAKTREYLLATLFLKDTGKIIFDRSVQEEYANLDMIDRLIESFSLDDIRYTIIVDYCNRLYEKQLKNQTTIRSVRLALTPAAKFLHYCNNFKESEINDNALSGYLWVYHGQRSAIYGFINFLNNNHRFSLQSHRTKPIIGSSRYSKKQLKTKLVQLLREPEENEKYRRYLFRIALGYCHNLDLPDNAFIQYTNIKKKKNGTHYIRLIGRELYLPEDIVRNLKPV